MEAQTRIETESGLLSCQKSNTGSKNVHMFDLSLPCLNSFGKYLSTEPERYWWPILGEHSLDLGFYNSEQRAMIIQ